jgi:uncharacterized protein (DUF924 family)
MAAMETIESVLDFWLGPHADADTVSKEQTSRWFKKDPAFDSAIRERFTDDIERGLRGELDAWASSARGALALVVLLDQFPRNAFRGTPRSFAYDAKARDIAKRALARQLDEEVLPVASVFFYLPLEHSENASDQADAVEGLERCAVAAKGEVKALLDSYVQYAHKHKDIIDRFGRFPHRNAILGRASTPEELEFLEGPGSSF